MNEDETLKRAKYLFGSDRSILSVLIESPITVIVGKDYEAESRRKLEKKFPEKCRQKKELEIFIEKEMEKLAKQKGDPNANSKYVALFEEIFNREQNICDGTSPLLDAQIRHMCRYARLKIKYIVDYIDKNNGYNVRTHKSHF